MLGAVVNAFIPLTIGILLLTKPQVFMKKDLEEEKEVQIVKQFKTIGIIAIVAGVLIFIGSLMSG